MLVKLQYGQSNDQIMTCDSKGRELKIMNDGLWVNAADVSSVKSMLEVNEFAPPIYCACITMQCGDHLGVVWKGDDGFVEREKDLHSLSVAMTKEKERELEAIKRMGQHTNMMWLVIIVFGFTLLKLLLDTLKGN